MSLGRSVLWFASAALVVLAGCGAGGGSSSTVTTVTSVTQDLSVDPEGLTTVVSFSANPGALSVANFASNGGQSPQSVSIVGSDATVVWDAIVTPSSRVRVIGVEGIDSSFTNVTSSDPSAPTFAVASATMVAGWGNDTISVQFSGPHVQQSMAENLTKWQIKVGGVTMDLTGSVFSFDPSQQILSITTGVNCNLHASFTLRSLGVKSVSDVAVASSAVNGVASGDSSAPTLVSALQNLTADDLGRVVDFKFSESMDPIFCPSLANFLGAGSDVASDATMTAQDTIEVTFNNPMVPGVDSVDLENLMDAHGNLLGSQITPIAAGSNPSNAFTSPPTLTTVADAGGDFVQAVFDQALDPDDANDYTHWNLEIPTGTPVDLSTATVDFDLATKTLTITLPDDYLNGTTFTFGAASGSEPHDVDGDLFTDSIAGVISGDVAAPTLTAATQNRNVDPTGMTVDVHFSEAVDATTAENAANYGDADGANVLSATLLPSKSVVRLVLDAIVYPGNDGIAVGHVLDLAGNMMTQASMTIDSTDTTPPSPVNATATAVEGANNDTLRVTFNDDMLSFEAADHANWHVESPIGTVIDASHASIAYNAAGRTATLTFDGNDNINFKRSNSFKVHFTTMHDIGGNVVSATNVTGTVTAETTLPVVDSVWVETAFANKLHVRFSEPCDLMDDLGGDTIYRIFDNTGVLKGTPVSATPDADSLGVTLTCGFAVLAGSDTLDVYGVTDLAGNYLFPALSQAVEVEDSGEPTLTTSAMVATSASGEDNDVITVSFDRRPSVWKLLSPSNWTLTDGVTTFDLSNSSFSFDGATTVTISLDGLNDTNLQTGTSYQISIDNMKSAQGVALSSPSSDSATCAGDSTAPTLPLNKARLDAASPTDSILIEMNEAIDFTDAGDTSLVDINGTNPDSATWLGPRTVMATWSGGVLLGDTVNVNYHDLAGNLGSVSRAIAAADVSGPLVASISGTAVANRGGDVIRVNYTKPVDLTTGLDVANYAATMNGTSFSLAGSHFTYVSSSNQVVIHLAAGSELKFGATIHLDISGVTDHAGLVMNPPASINGVVSGDSTPPSFVQAFVNWRESANGEVVDVLFDEDVDETFAGDVANWTSSTGLVPLTVVEVTPRQWRLTMNLPPVSTDDVEIVDVPDDAQNLSGTIQTTILIP